MSEIKIGDYVKTRGAWLDSLKVGKVLDIVEQDGVFIYDCTTVDGDFSFYDPRPFTKKDAVELIAKYQSKIDWLKNV